MSDSRSRFTVGIIGGGQLARMMGLAGLPLGWQFRTYDPSAEACAGQLMPLQQGAFDAIESLVDFANGVDVLTFDFENVPAQSVAHLMQQVAVHPNANALATAQDRLTEKTTFNRLGIPTPRFADITSREDLAAAVEALGLPAILKTRRLGYDGKGQFRLKTSADIEAAWQALGAQVSNTGLILEAFVPFQRELSVIAVRHGMGQFATWPLTENWHVDGVLSASLAPAGVLPEQAERAIGYARTLAESLNYVGVFALELFDCGDQLLANEMAPRVHNSGHWTIEGAETSQFENHLRAISGLPLGSTAARGHSCMLNFLGEMPAAAAMLGVPGAHWHDYGKTSRPGRKVGHATVRADSREALLTALKAAGAALSREEQIAPVLARLQATP